MHQCKICITTTGEQKSNHRCICNTLSGKCEICTEQIVEVLGLSEWKVVFFLHDGGWRKGGRGCWSSREGWCIVQAHNELLSPTLQFNLPSRCLDSNSSGLAGSTHTHTNYSSHTKERIWKTTRGRLFDGKSWSQRVGGRDWGKERDRKGGRMTFGTVPFFLFIFLSPFSDIHLLLCSTGARRLLEKDCRSFSKWLQNEASI